MLTGHNSRWRDDTPNGCQSTRLRRVVPAVPWSGQACDQDCRICTFQWNTMSSIVEHAVAGGLATDKAYTLTLRIADIVTTVAIACDDAV